MSALARSHEGGALTGLRMTAREYLALGETADRYELVNGVVLLAPSASFPHNQAAAEVLFQLMLVANKAGNMVVVHEADIRFSNSDVHRPDMVAYRASRISGRPMQLDVVPDLIVEVISEARKPFDLITKRNDYERFGVRECWVVDPSDGSVRCWRRKAGGRKLVEATVEGDALRCKALPGFALNLARLRTLVGGGARRTPPLAAKVRRGRCGSGGGEGGWGGLDAAARLRDERLALVIGPDECPITSRLCRIPRPGR